MSEQDGRVWVFCTVAVRTSAGAEVGAKQLPVAEAARLVADKRAVYGDQPPTGFGAIVTGVSN